MKIDSHQPYLVFDKFIYRCPIYSISDLKDIYSQDTILSSNDLLKDQIFQGAIFIASPDLFRDLELFLEDRLAAERLINFKIALLKYIVRMCSRSTPFGLFAGCGLGKIGNVNSINLKPRSEFKAITRLDMHYLDLLATTIMQDKWVRERSLYFTNNTIYTVGQKFRYAEYKLSSSKRRKHLISSVERTHYLDRIISMAQSGCHFTKLRDSLLADCETPEEATHYLHLLIDNKILISGLEPTVIGKNSFQKFYSQLKSIGYSTPSLDTTKSLLEDLNDQPIGMITSGYRALTDHLQSSGYSPNGKYLLQTDLLLQAESPTINKSLVKSVLDSLRIVNRLVVNTYEKSQLMSFKRLFKDRYETEEVPLLQALDPEIGIGFGSMENLDTDINPLLDGLRISPDKKEQGRLLSIDRRSRYLLAKYEAFLNSPSDEIEIQENELQSVSESWQDLPDTLYVLINVLHNSQSEPLIQLGPCGGSSAANLFSRFSHLNPEIEEFIKEIGDKEKEYYPDSILAEIVHLPEARVGNIVFRSTTREYEIAYLSHSSVDDQYSIPVNDLYVSVINDRIKLRSKKLNKEILPRLTSAHNFSHNATGLYHFLASLQVQNKRPNLFFEWGPLFDSFSFKPRIRFKNVIIIPATWRIAIKEMLDLPFSHEESFYREVINFKNLRKIPDLVYLSAGDNKLLINFGHVLSVQMLLSDRSKPLVLIEVLSDDRHTVAKHNESPYESELILTLYKNE